MDKAMFIVVEGPDGSGKTTCSEMLVDKLNLLGTRAMYIHEPGAIEDSEVSQTLKKLTKEHRLEDDVYSLLFAASQRYTIENLIYPKINDEHTTIICDRFIRSLYVYQNFYKNDNYNSYMLKSHFDTLTKMILGYHTNPHIIPDMEFVLWANPDVAYDRICKRNNVGTDVWEQNKQFIQSVNGAYKELEDKTYMLNYISDCKFIDTSEITPEEVVDEMLKAINQREYHV